MASGSIAPEGSNQSQKSAQKDSERNHSVRLWAGVVIVALVVGGGVWYWVNDHNPARPDQFQKTVDNNLPSNAVVSDNVEASDDPRPADFVPDECIVQYKPDATVEQKEATRARFKAELKQDLRYVGDIAKAEAEPGGAEVVTFDFGMQAQDMSQDERKKRDLTAIAKLSEDPNVLTAEPNYIIRKLDDHYSANDDYYVRGRLWGVTTQGLVATDKTPQQAPRKKVNDLPHDPSKLERATANTKAKRGGARNGSNKAAAAASNPCEIGAPLRSSYTTHADQAWLAGHIGDKKVLVGVVDSGIQPSHPDLAANISKQIGKDFSNPDNEELFAKNEDPHGTHVAGIIAAVGGNKIGVAGMVWNATLVEAKFLGPDGSGDTASAIQAIKWLTYERTIKGQNIVAINASWASPRKSPALLNAIKEAGKAKILLVAAAGNDHFDTDGKYKSYPADYDTARDTYDKAPALDYNSVISVAAIGEDGSLASFSNYGAYSVQIAAPGVDILSTWTGSGYKCDSGTSMAAPFVTGAVALYASSHPQASAQEIRKAILSSVTPDPALAGKVASGGTLNVSTF